MYLSVYILVVWWVYIEMGRRGLWRERERCVIVILMEGDGGEAHGGYDNRIWMDGSAANK